MLVVLVNDFNAFYCLLVMVWWGVLLYAMQGIGCLAGHLVALQGIWSHCRALVVLQGIGCHAGYKGGWQGLFPAASE